MLHSSTHHPIFCQRSCSFHCLSIQPECRVLHSSSLILSSFASLLNQSVIWNLSYPLCHSFNSSGGRVLLISSSILSSCQDHVQFLPFTVGVLPKLHHSYSFYILFNRSVLSIIPLLTGVSSKCYNFAKFIFYALHFQPECCRNWSLSFLVHLVSTEVLACTSCPLQPFSYVFQPTKFS